MQSWTLKTRDGRKKRRQPPFEVEWKDVIERVRISAVTTATPGTPGGSCEATTSQSRAQ
jgi:hypothetical protein